VNHPVKSLSAYLDGEIAAPERALLEAHLAGCASCRAERDRLSRALALIAELPPAPAPSETFEPRFYARLAAEKAKRRPFLERLRWRFLAPGLAGLAASAAVALLAVRHEAHRRSEEAFLAQHLDLFESYQAVASVDAVESPEDVEVVAHLDELGVRP